MTSRLAPFAAIGLALALAVPGGASPSGPELSVAADRMDPALSCPESFTSTHDPVLLVHGTATDAADTWSWGYQPVLGAAGFDVCVVNLPDRSLGDIQVASEYVVHAVRVMAAATGRPVDIVGHSQGALESRWALRWWPDLAARIDDMVSLAGPHHGASGADMVCITGTCAPAAHQMRDGARFLDALNAGDETPGDLSWTSVASRFDELVQPPSTARLDGAVNIVVQDLCPGRPVHHGGFLHDAAVFALVLDALVHPGPADPVRFDPAICAQGSLPGVDPVAGNARLYGNAFQALLAYEGVSQEPAPASYATAG